MDRRPAPIVVALALAAVVAVVVAGCGGEPGSRRLRPHWHEVSLPVPPGQDGRIAVRDATACAGHWVLVGGVLGADGASRPAAWTSEDARTWRPLRLDPSAYYARRALLVSVACRDGTIAAIGSRSGGAHGNPRVTSWYQRSDGALVDMPATFELYGGPEALSVRHVVPGARGWLIVGNRLSGAATWVSADATDFRIVDDDPALRSGPGESTSALDAVDDESGWTVVGRVEADGRVSPAPLAWTSADGDHWSREPVPAATSGFADLERVARAGSGTLVALGLRDGRFGTWRRSDGRWRAESSFGRFSADLSGPPFVSALAARSGALVAAVSDGAHLQVWADPGNGWRRVAVPVEPPATGDTQLALAGDDSTVVLLSDDGTTGRVWTASWAELGAPAL